jgi:hypothetical protein
MEILGKTAKNLVHDNRRPRRNLNRAPAECKSSHHPLGQLALWAGSKKVKKKKKKSKAIPVTGREGP